MRIKLFLVVCLVYKFTSLQVICCDNGLCSLIGLRVNKFTSKQVYELNELFVTTMVRVICVIRSL